MTKRERAAAAAKWRRIARAFERNVRPNGRGYSASEVVSGGLCYAAVRTHTRSGGIDLFVPRPSVPSNEYWYWYFWPLTRKGDDCRVIAAGLIAAMYESGEFDS